MKMKKRCVHQQREGAGEGGVKAKIKMEKESKESNDDREEDEQIKEREGKGRYDVKEENEIGLQLLQKAECAVNKVCEGGITALQCPMLVGICARPFEDAESKKEEMNYNDDQEKNKNKKEPEGEGRDDMKEENASGRQLLKEEECAAKAREGMAKYVKDEYAIRLHKENEERKAREGGSKLKEEHADMLHVMKESCASGRHSLVPSSGTDCGPINITVEGGVSDVPGECASGEGLDLFIMLVAQGETRKAREYIQGFLRP